MSSNRGILDGFEFSIDGVGVATCIAMLSLLRKLLYTL